MLSTDAPKFLRMPVALERLRRVYERYEPEDVTRLIDAVTGLEALLLADGGMAELKYRLEIRAAILVGRTTEERIDIARRSGKAYDLRSSLVQTGKVSDNVKSKSAELERFATNLLRQVIFRLLLTDFAADKTRSQMAEAWLRTTLTAGAGLS